MGGSTYSLADRTSRASAMNFVSAPMDQTFTQQKEQRAHKDMLPEGIVLREACDSEVHPNTVPVQLWLDVTGSMREIPHQLIKHGLPKMISKIIESGVPDVALMFGAIGDHECDRYPLQVAQFESGDAELDMWLTRTYLEGGGGGNGGESYLLAHYFAGSHTRTDSFFKRHRKGIVITVGDEPPLKYLPNSAIKTIMGDTAVTSPNGKWTAKELLDFAQSENYVYHIHIDHNYRLHQDWKDLLGQQVICVKDPNTLPDVIADIVLKHSKMLAEPEPLKEAVENNVAMTPKTEIIL